MHWTTLAKDTTPATGYKGGGKSPAAIGATIAIHVAVAALVILIPAKIIVLEPDGGLITENIPLPPEPPVEPQIRPETKTKVTVPDHPEVAGTTTTGPTFVNNPGPEILPAGNGGTTVDPPSVPVFVDASIDPRNKAGFQPDYPGSMIRQQIEGFVTLRVFISDEGRVTAAELIKATDSAFWDATRKQAMKYWRFRPATRDGVPVASERVMTVRFRLADV